MKNLIKIATESILKYNKSRYAKNLLDACQHWTGETNLTMQDFMTRLKWEYRGRVSRQGPTWHLLLDDFMIGWYGGTKKYLPKIDTGICPGHLGMLPIID